MDIVFRIMMHGLIALAPSTTPNDLNHITALLLDTQMTAQHDDVCESGHHPELTFRLADIQENAGKCFAAGCSQIGNQCSCALGISKKKITLDLPGPLSNPTLEPLDDNRANNNGLPSVGAIGSMRYVARLTKPPFNLRLLDSEMLDQHLYARMEVPFEKLTSCSLSKREDQGDTYVIPMGVRALGDRSRASDQSQAFAQMVVASFLVPAEQPVSITISDFDGLHPTSMVLAAGDKGYLINLSNEPDGLGRDALCDDGVARHFAHYYDLTEDPPSWNHRKVPHARFTQGIKISDPDPDPATDEAGECKDLYFTLMDRPICPMGDFL